MLLKTLLVFVLYVGKEKDGDFAPGKSGKLTDLDSSTPAEGGSGESDKQNVEKGLL